MRLTLLLVPAFAVLAACATGSFAQKEPQHGRASTLSAATSESSEFCEHRVPEENCVKCHPELAAQFKATGDWCGEHGVPESQCYECHPNLTFTPIPKPPPDADIQVISAKGEDVEGLAPHAAAGKVTVFDFYADWCPPCREVDAYVINLLHQRKDVAYRKLNVVDWDSPLAKRYLANVPNLPYVVVYGRDGREVARVSGLDLAALEKAIQEGAAK